MFFILYHKPELNFMRGNWVMKIAIASDHGGVELKKNIINFLQNQNLEVADMSPVNDGLDDYPDFAEIVVKELAEKQADWGILICGTGIGISIAANRHKGIRAAILYDNFTAESAKVHNNANIVVFGGRTMTAEQAIERLKIFMTSRYEGGRHEQRLCKLDK